MAITTLLKSFARLLAVYALCLMLISSPGIAQNGKYALWKTPSLLRGFNVLNEAPKSLKDFIDLRESGATLAYLACNGFRAVDPPYDVASANIAETDALVGLCRATQMRYAIAVRQGPGRRDVFLETNFLADRSTIWKNKTEQSLYARMLAEIVERYGSDPLFIGIAPIVEPNPLFDAGYTTPAQLSQMLSDNDIDMFGMNRTFIEHIRDVDPNLPILLQNSAFSSAEFFSLMDVYDDPYIVYEFHCYRPIGYVKDETPNSRQYPGDYLSAIDFGVVRHDKAYIRDRIMQRVRDFQRLADVPIFLGEFGLFNPQIGGPQLLRDLSEICLEFGWHFAFWDWRRPSDHYNYEAMGPEYWNEVLRAFALKPRLRGADALALADLFRQTSGSSWHNAHGWLQSMDSARWHGLELTIVSEGATEAFAARSLTLVDNNLRGTIDALRLPDLEYLDLSDNRISGEFPVGEMPRIASVRIANCDFSGAMSDIDLQRLNILDVSGNGYNELPTNIDAPALEDLILESNRFQGALPNMNLPRLARLSVAENELSGVLSLEGVPNLQQLDISGNRYVGELPGFALPELRILRADRNLFHRITADLNVPRLEVLSIRDNLLTDLPDLTAIQFLAEVRVERNRLGFGPIENNISIPEFFYAPQDTTITLRHSPIQGGTQLNAKIDGTFNAYQWFNNGAEIVGANSSAYEVRDLGKYYCRITNAVVGELVLQTDTAEFNIHAYADDAPDALYSYEDPISAYPNPASGNITIHWSDKLPGIVSITIADALGNIVFERSKFTEGADRMEMVVVGLNDWPSGAYVCTLQSPGGSAATTFVVLR